MQYLFFLHRCDRTVNSKGVNCARYARLFRATYYNVVRWYHRASCRLVAGPSRRISPPRVPTKMRRTIFGLGMFEIVLYKKIYKEKNNFVHI